VAHRTADQRSDPQHRTSRQNTAIGRELARTGIEGIRDPAIAAGLIEPEVFDAGVRALHRTTKADGVFCYTFFKGVGEKKPT
jgi:hypothetical protein